MKTLTSLLCLKCPNVFPPHSHWVKVPTMASKVRSGLDYLSDLSFSHLASYTEGISHTGLLVLSWTLQEHLKPLSQQCGILFLQILVMILLHFFWISAKMSRSSPHHHGLPFVALFFPVAVVIMIFIYFTNVLYVFVYYLISAHSLITPWNISSSGQTGSFSVLCVAASPAPEMIPGVCQTGKHLLDGSMDGLSHKGYTGTGWGRAMTVIFGRWWQWGYDRVWTRWKRASKKKRQSRSVVDSRRRQQEGCDA